MGFNSHLPLLVAPSPDVTGVLWVVSLHVPSQMLTGSLVVVQLSSNLKAAIFSLSKSILNTGLWEKSFPTLLTMGDFFFPYLLASSVLQVQTCVLLA